MPPHSARGWPRIVLRSSSFQSRNEVSNARSMASSRFSLSRHSRTSENAGEEKKWWVDVAFYLTWPTHFISFFLASRLCDKERSLGRHRWHQQTLQEGTILSALRTRFLGWPFCSTSAAAVSQCQTSFFFGAVFYELYTWWKFGNCQTHFICERTEASGRLDAHYSWRPYLWYMRYSAVIFSKGQCLSRPIKSRRAFQSLSFPTTKAKTR